MKVGREFLVWIVLAFLLFFTPVYTALFILSGITAFLYFRRGFLRAVAVGLVPLVVVLADCFMSGDQTAFRQSMFSIQAILLFYILRNEH